MDGTFSFGVSVFGLLVLGRMEACRRVDWICRVTMWMKNVLWLIVMELRIIIGSYFAVFIDMVLCKDDLLHVWLLLRDELT